MNARDELRGALCNTICNASNYTKRAQPYLLGSDMSEVLDRTADAILASGYRKPRTITTAEELDALPVGSIVLDRTGDTARKFRGGWRTTVAEPDGTAWLSGHMADADLPATVLHEGAAT